MSETISLEQVRKIGNLTYVWTGSERHTLCHTVEELVEALREQLSASWPPQPSTHPYPRHLEPDFQRYIAARGRAEALLAQLDRQE